VHTTPRNTPRHNQGFDGFQPFAFTCKARNLTAQLEALRAKPPGRIPANAQDIDASQPETYVPGLSKAVL
jgi:hypothetical protein